MNIKRIKDSSNQLATNLRQAWPVDPAAVVTQQRRRFHVKFRRSKTFRRRFIRYSLMALYVLILGGVAGFVVYSPQADGTLNNQVSILDNNASVTSPLDQLSAASVAVNVAQVSHLSEAVAVRNQADSVNADINIMPAGDGIVSKPQVVSAALKSRKDIQTYVVQAGDTVSSLAVKFGVSSDSIKWSNNLSSDSLKVGTTLTIPPVNGFTYTVQKGDTPESLASKYKTTADQIIAFNDAEIGGLQPGELIVIPNGQKVIISAPVVVSSFKYNGYDYGYCTYWVALRRIQVGKPLPIGLGDASRWKTNAINKYGMGDSVHVGNPQKYAAAVTSFSGAGHVVFVEEVYSDGSILVSEMNHIGWGKTDTRVFSADEAARLTYID